MNKAETTLRIYKTGVMAVVRVDTIERGIEIAEGCLAGGVDILEISYTNNNAGEVIHAIKDKLGKDILVGAGTVLEETTARMAIIDGAEFIIAPTFDEGVQEMCNLFQIPYAPGATTYTEMVTGLKKGAAFIKAFPISNYYGPSLSKTVKTPCPQMPILASGGINLDNAAEWVKNGTDCLAVGGLLTKGTKEDIAANARKLRGIVTENREK